MILACPFLPALAVSEMLHSEISSENTGIYRKYLPLFFQAGITV